MKVHLNDWGVKQMKTKWGNYSTCRIGTSQNWLNLELPKKPIRCLEYILEHEMTHLLVRHHSDDFIDCMDSFFRIGGALRRN